MCLDEGSNLYCNMLLQFLVSIKNLAGRMSGKDCGGDAGHSNRENRRHKQGFSNERTDHIHTFNTE